MYKNIIKMAIAMVFAMLCAFYAEGIGLMSTVDDIMCIVGIVIAAIGFVFVDNYAQWVTEWVEK